MKQHNVNLYWLVDRGRKQRRNDEFIEGLAPNLSIKMSIFWIIVGLLVLVSSAKALIEGAVYLAHYFEIPELVIGLTLVAVGTSLPELAASLIATLKKEYGIAVGNVIGSNIFNLTLVLSAPGFVTPNQPITNRVFLTDLPVMVLMTMILVFLGFKKDNQDKIGRYSGALFLVIYVVYIGFMAVEQMV